MSTGPSHRIWVSRVIDRISSETVEKPLLVGVGTLGVIPIILSLIFLGLLDDLPPTRFLVAHVLAMSVPTLGVPAIWYWDERVYPRFIKETSDLAKDPGEVRDVAKRYEAVFATRYLVFAIPWTILIVGIIALNVPFFESIGVTGMADPAFWAYLIFAGWWGLITGIGFHGALTAIRAIRAVGDLRLQIDPLSPDGLGGLSSVGTLAIWTTMLISLGSLTLPLAFILGAEGGYRPLIFLAVGLYILVIAVSFVYPTLYVNRRAQEIREAELEDRRQRIRRLQTEASDIESMAGSHDEATMDDIATRLEIQRLRDEFTEYSDVNLYPLSIGILFRLVSSLVLPIFFIIVESYLGQFL